MDYFKELTFLFYKIRVSDNNGKNLKSDESFEKIVKKILAAKINKNKIILIGNGGSASIASHISTDFLKNAKLPALVFNDSSLITCLSNDLGYDNVFDKPIIILSVKGDILFAISSSGRSKNILKATESAKRKGCFVITLSGFDISNPLRKLGDINFHVPSNSYGFVEITHLGILHNIADRVKSDK